MDINTLDDRLSNYNDNKGEKEKLLDQIGVIEECLNVVEEDSLIINYDFSDAIELLDAFDYSIENLTQVISDIKNVIAVRKELNLSDLDIPYDEKQEETFNLFVDLLKKIKKQLLEKLRKLLIVYKDNTGVLDPLRNIFDGVGRRKYYTDVMVEGFYNTVDIFGLSFEEAKSILDKFYQTKNLSTQQEISEVNFEEVLNLYKEYLTPLSMDFFKKLLNDYKREVVTVIDLDSAREILEFFKDKGILEEFRRTALLKITLYGRLEYIRDVVYPKVMANSSSDIEAFFTDDLVSVWITEKGLTRKSSFRRSVKRGDSSSNETLHQSCHKIDYDGLEENIELLKANRHLFSDKFDPDDLGSNLNIKTMPVWALKKNIELSKLFNLGVLTPIPPTCLEKGDIENKLHLAIELGLLNSPLTQEFRVLDKDIVRSEEFQSNCARKKWYNQSIRNYFQRYLSKLSAKTINEYAILFHKLLSDGHLSFYNDFFSPLQAGAATPEIFTDAEKNILNDRDKMDDFVSNNFMIDWYSSFIDNFDEYDEIILDYDEEEKDSAESYKSYIDPSILDDDLIKDLDKNNTVVDVLSQNGEIVERKNEFVYMFGDRIISRYKVLHNASILKDFYRTLTNDMLLASIVRNSFLDKKSFELIRKSVMGKGVEL